MDALDLTTLGPVGAIILAIVVALKESIPPLLRVARARGREEVAAAPTSDPDMGTNAQTLLRECLDLLKEARRTHTKQQEERQATRRLVEELHGWHDVVNPETGAKIWYVGRVEKTLERMADTMDRAEESNRDLLSAIRDLTAEIRRELDEADRKREERERRRDEGSR